MPSGSHYSGGSSSHGGSFGGSSHHSYGNNSSHSSGGFHGSFGRNMMPVFHVSPASRQYLWASGLRFARSRRGIRHLIYFLGDSDYGCHLGRDGLGQCGQ